MTLTEFKKLANNVAAKYGIKENDVTVMASVFGTSNGERMCYTCQAWVSKLSKHIYSKNLQDYEMALISFNDSLEFSFKEYESEKKDIEI